MPRTFSTVPVKPRMAPRGPRWSVSAAPILLIARSSLVVSPTDAPVTVAVSMTGTPFSTLGPEWQLTNYLDDLPGFTASTDRLRYKSWNFRDIAQANGLSFPLVPDSTAGPDYSHLGILRAGSGKHVRVVQPPGFAAVDLQLSGGSGNPFPSEVAPRIALVRIR